MNLIVVAMHGTAKVCMHAKIHELFYCGDGLIGDAYGTCSGDKAWAVGQQISYISYIFLSGTVYLSAQPYATFIHRSYW